MSTIKQALAATCIMTGVAMSVQPRVVAQSPAISSPTVSPMDLLPGNSTCEHVIDLIQRYDRSNESHLQCPEELGDLVLTDIERCDDAGLGPRFRIVVLNDSCRRVRDFRVSAVLVHGYLGSISPNATVCVREIPAKQAVSVDVQLPPDALEHKANAGICRLLVVIDSFDEFIETNERNNFKVCDLESIPVFVPPPTETPVLEDVVPASPVAISPNSQLEAFTIPGSQLPEDGIPPTSQQNTRLRNAEPRNADLRDVIKSFNDVEVDVQRQPQVSNPAVIGPLSPADPS